MSDRALLIVDVQRDYFPGGGHPLVEPDAAAAATSRVLESFRAAGDAVLHLKHVWDEPEATYLRPDSDGVEIHPAVAPAEGEAVIEKEAPNGFLGTKLEDELRSREVAELVVAGMESCMCVDATVRAAVDLGFEATVVHDACTAAGLEFGDREIPGDVVHAAFMAALADGYAEVVSADELLAG
jgi:nicotinamidase-related amidase